MLEVWQTGTPALRLSTKPTSTRLPQTVETSETPQAGRGERTGWIPQGVRTYSAVHPREWQKPRRTSQLERQQEQFIQPLTNRFSQLLETELASQVHPDIGGKYTTPPPKKPYLPRPRRPRNQRASPRVAKTEPAGEVRVQPHGYSYFLPGKVIGRGVTFLLDSGCTTNLLSRRVFNTLPLKERKELSPYTGEPSTLADGSSIPFDGVIKLTRRVRDQAIQEIFVISPLEEDAIIWMPF